ncbi:hypothetical protein [Frigoriflavimonas asaccharolytica]|uniref:Uncharacterized protein n=1 Tax=Frigoriflavimonas asaccharolytica TaxID=2735899 RepID=A0A8J8GBP9_9FLAO|nr:hypothetical protein [Frigoriflavimonas asaccharolytica]NRS93025.1 hypothetical protein [Frigoriflavimonas asaccharolytica]
MNFLSKNKNALFIGLLSGTLFAGLSLFYDFVIDDSLQRPILYYIVFFVIYFLMGYGTAIATFRNKNLNK